MKGAAYGRLSRDEDSEQESLKNQEQIVVGHMRKGNHKIIDIIMDDNCTGMNFERPGIKRMFELARNGEIDAVFVKDLSRLGRHRTLTLECIDKLRLLGVRVISVTENIDSFNESDDLIIGFKGLINDSYSKDIQRKVIYGFRQKQQKGLVMIPPMGYFKDKNTNEVVIVEEPAEIVRTIFKLYLEGYGLKAIARILNETELEIQKILMERIEDKQNADMYDKMIDARRNDIENFKKEVYEIENLDKTIKDRKSTLKHSIELLDDIIAENNISNANLHLMFDKIIIEETEEGLNLDLKLKSPFISKNKEDLLKKYFIVDDKIFQ